jgi:glycosyltransferase
VHDIESLRTGATASSEKLLLNSDIIIVHSTEMANKLKEKGFKGKTVPLEFFDYYSNIKNNTNVSKTTKNILFAGNLEKSTFLYKLNNAITDPQITYLLYGKKNSDLPLSKQIIYKGMFDAEQFSLVEGNWGLVWDGDSIDTCAGPYGKYLQINAPFKLSLYLAMNIPVIVWNKSAMAKYVKKYHLGICVDNLKEISTKIDALSENDLAQIYIGVSKASLDVKQGEKIKSVIQKLENI